MNRPKKKMPNPLSRANLGGVNAELEVACAIVKRLTPAEFERLTAGVPKGHADFWSKEDLEKYWLESLLIEAKSSVDFDTLIGSNDGAGLMRAIGLPVREGGADAGH